MSGLKQRIVEIWDLTKGYWQSEERLSAWLLLGSIVGLNLGLVGVNVFLNIANGRIFTALEKHDGGAFYAAFGSVILLILLYLTVALLRAYLNQTLQLRWRRWLTKKFLSRWLADRVFYRMRFSGQVDNPDQRISEDVRLYIQQSLALGLGLLNSLTTLASFAAILWTLSGSLTFTVFDIEVTIPGYMFWVAVLYSGIGSVIAHLVGRPLIRLTNRQQALEADFRFSLVRLREEAEGIALYGGEAQERRTTFGRFHSLYDNSKRLIVRNIQFMTFQLFVGQFATFFSLLVASPRYFSGAIQLGVMMQVSNAFAQVNDSLSWLINSYPVFAEWQATMERLTELSRELKKESEAKDAGADIATADEDSIELTKVTFAMPDGTPLLAPVTLSLKKGEAVLVKGSSGGGKSTLFRVLSGLWPFAGGSVRMPKGASTLFLPQRPYMPIGSLRLALWFPAKPAPDRDKEALAALAAVDLEDLGPRLDEVAHWAHVLSGGEQQRLAIARALLIKPDWLFLDEATSATDEDQEAQLYSLLAERLTETTIISVGHRRSLDAFHRRVLTFERKSGHAGRLVDGQIGKPTKKTDKVSA